MHLYYKLSNITIIEFHDFQHTKNLVMRRYREDFTTSKLILPPYPPFFW